MPDELKRDVMIDPVTAEVVRHALAAIPDQLDVNIMRTAYSPLIYEYKDYAVGIVDADGRLISQCKGGIPLFVTNTLGTAVRDGLAVYGREAIAPGDVIVTNYVESQGQHLNNVVMYTPVHDADGVLLGFVAIVVHWVDIGGATQGSISNQNTTIFQEGLHLRTIKLIAKGERVEEIFRIIEHNTRTPEMLFGDIDAQIAGCMMGREMLAGVLTRYGVATVNAAIARMWDRSVAIARQAVEQHVQPGRAGHGDADRQHGVIALQDQQRRAICIIAVYQDFGDLGKIMRPQNRRAARTVTDHLMDLTDAGVDMDLGSGATACEPQQIGRHDP